MYSAEQAFQLAYRFYEFDPRNIHREVDRIPIPLTSKTSG